MRCVHGIDVRWENEHGEALGVVDDPHNLLECLLPDPPDTSSCCLRFIDRDGDTVFNQLQMPQLAAELEYRAKIPLDAAAQEHLHALLDLVRSADCQVHTYIKFYGD